MIKGLVFPDFLPRFVGRIEQSVDRDRTQILFQERIERPGFRQVAERQPQRKRLSAGQGQFGTIDARRKERCVARSESDIPPALAARRQINAERESGFSDTQHGPARHGPVGIVSQQYVRRQRVRKFQSAERYGLKPGQYGQVDRNVKPDALAGLGAHEQRTPAEIQFAQRPERPVLVEQSLFQSPPQNISVGAYRRQ